VDDRSQVELGAWRARGPASFEVRRLSAVHMVARRQRRRCRFVIVVDDEDSRNASGLWQPGNACRQGYDGNDTVEDPIARGLR
jgi:hypothetical protein